MSIISPAPARLWAEAHTLRALVSLAEQHPDLPAAYMPVSASNGPTIVQLESLEALEAWREALGVDPAELRFDLAATFDRFWLRFSTTWLNVPLEVYAMSATTDRLAGLLLEQHHQIDDPAVMDYAVRPAVPVLGRAA